MESQMSISTVINYCTNDFRFIDRCIEEAQFYSDQITIPYCSHFFDGKKENRALLEKSIQKHSNVSFIEYAYSSNPYGTNFVITSEDLRWAHFLHSTSRYIGYVFEQASDYILFLDVDEIPDGKQVKEFLLESNYTEYSALRFLSFYYFRSALKRAKSFSKNALLAKRNSLSESALLHTKERLGTFENILGKKRDNILGKSGNPLFHHYSFVGAEKELFQKITSWGHRRERNWETMLLQELKNEPCNKESIFGLEYEDVEAFFNPLEVQIPNSKIGNSSLDWEEKYENYRFVDRTKVKRYLLEKEFLSEQACNNH